MTAARNAFFLDVGELAAGRHLAVSADDAPARERCVPQKPYETHKALMLVVAKRAIAVPLSFGTAVRSSPPVPE
jgi:hypothetical protein